MANSLPTTTRTATPRDAERARWLASSLRGTPRTIARSEGVDVHVDDLSCADGSTVRGLYAVQSRQIILSRRLGKAEADHVVAHNIAHHLVCVHGLAADLDDLEAFCDAFAAIITARKTPGPRGRPPLHRGND